MAECEADELQEEESRIDDVQGGFLVTDLVTEARVEELASYREMQVYCRLRVVECVVPTKWSRGDGWAQNKRDERSLDIRCQLTVEEVQNATEEGELQLLRFRLHFLSRSISRFRKR